MCIHYMVGAPGEGGVWENSTNWARTGYTAKGDSAPYLSLASSAVYGYTMSGSPPFLSMDGCKPHTYGGQVSTFTFSAVVTFEFDVRCQASLDTVVCHKLTGILACP